MSQLSLFSALGQALPSHSLLVALAWPRPLVIFCLWPPGLAQAPGHLLLVSPMAWPRPLVIFCLCPSGLAQASCHLLLVAPWPGPGPLSSFACGPLALARGGSDKVHDAMPGPCFLSSFACGHWAPVPLHHEPYFWPGPVPVIFCLWPCFGPGPCIVTVGACTVDWS